MIGWCALPIGFALIAWLMWQRSSYMEIEALTMSPPVASGGPPTTAFYVSPAGSDAADGSARAPWATIQHATELATAGTIVHVAPGTYIGAINTTTSGTSAARITFLADTKWEAKVIAPHSYTAWENRGDYVDIEGFDITGDGNQGILNLGSNVRIIGNHVHDIPAKCSQDGGAGIDNGNYSASDDDVIDNVVHDIGSLSVKCGTVQGIYHANLRGHIMNNIVYRAWAYGICLWHAPKDVVIANNLVYQNGEAGILIGAGDAPGGVVASGMIVANNTITDNPATTWGVGQAIVEVGLTGTDNKYINNLIWNNRRGIELQNGVVDVGTINAAPRLVNHKADWQWRRSRSRSSPMPAVWIVGSLRDTTCREI
ncbi:MAG: hypothetical protein JWM08_1652 [Candidatus Angelobacter sp.]|nr:hypothetical protein [Candidatus Angelobacter sp.]